MDVIVKKSGVSKSNIYYHFKNKEELILAIVDSEIERFQDDILTPVLAKSLTLGALEAIELYIKTIESNLLKGDCIAGCPFASLAIQLAQTNVDVRMRISQFFDDLRSQISRFLKKGMANGEIRKDISCDHLSMFMISSIEGALLLATIHQNGSVVEKTREIVTYLLTEKK